ncbi:DUF533 domain-containing protein [Profundibacterium mesophilum]|uniref:CDP-diacylglycerol--glycerol-3-phosphate 3-phosphatidyltransferase n=1 Tax=Profundibacterium mesophilum KAUST100406-0324 TaxID=1037889 RepID=A0A921NNT4_9RHOB|nr:DUF533 domain-containing protein [Profundibacterium mesophilum]KAF0675261.1 CDP-diacylglycerol--glycerol-3-phosphate 3-phosphatidyltransferase [Profundibacterium mesophilum KAUST100406-0324]
MSLKNMMTKMAIAFVAAKGVQTFRDQGGMEGVRAKLAQQKKPGGALHGSGSGGLSSMLGALGLSSGTATGSAQPGLAGLFGGLAGTTGGAVAASRMTGLLERTRADGPRTDDEAVGALMVRAMVQAAKADGEIDARERAALLDVVGDEDPEDRAFLEQEMAKPVDLDGLVKDTPKGLEVETYTASVMAIEPDNRAEAEYLDRLARGLSLDKKTVNEIHEANGKPILYSM